MRAVAFMIRQRNVQPGAGFPKSQAQRIQLILFPTADGKLRQRRFAGVPFFGRVPEPDERIMLPAGEPLQSAE